MKKEPIASVLKVDYSKLNAYSTGLLQGKAYRAMQYYLAKDLRIYDLSIPEWKLLGQLYDHGDMKLSAIADRLSVEAPLVTALIDSLEKKSFVKRRNNPNDKRAKIISATTKGKAIIPEIETSVKKTMNMLLEGVSREDLLTYIHVLERIIDNSQ